MVNANAIAETLIQLSENQQYKIAESFLSVCGAEELRQIASLFSRAFSVRMRYLLEKYLDRGVFASNRALLTAELVRILNKWCVEGRRSSVRRVLNELDENALIEISETDALDAEIYSMIREYKFIDHAPI